MIDIYKEVKELAKELPKFSDGRIDYSKSKINPVINCVVVFEGKVLIVKRSKKVIAYPERWNGISGFIDTLDSLSDIAKREVREELGVKENLVSDITEGEILVVDDKEINKTWHVVPVRVTLKSKPDIKLNWESTELKWVDPSEVGQYPHIPDFDEVVSRAMRA